MAFYGQGGVQRNGEYYDPRLMPGSTIGGIPSKLGRNFDTSIFGVPDQSKQYINHDDLLVHFRGDMHKDPGADGFIPVISDISGIHQSSFDQIEDTHTRTQIAGLDRNQRQNYISNTRGKLMSKMSFVGRANDYVQHLSGTVDSEAGADVFTNIAVTNRGVMSYSTFYIDYETGQSLSYPQAGEQVYAVVPPVDDNFKPLHSFENESNRSLICCASGDFAGRSGSLAYSAYDMIRHYMRSSAFGGPNVYASAFSNLLCQEVHHQNLHSTVLMDMRMIIYALTDAMMSYQDGRGYQVFTSNNADADLDVYVGPLKITLRRRVIDDSLTITVAVETNELSNIAWRQAHMISLIKSGNPQNVAARNALVAAIPRNGPTIAHRIFRNKQYKISRTNDFQAVRVLASEIAIGIMTSEEFSNVNNLTIIIDTATCWANYLEYVANFANAPSDQPGIVNNPYTQQARLARMRQHWAQNANVFAAANLNNAQIPFMTMQDIDEAVRQRQDDAENHVRTHPPAMPAAPVAGYDHRVAIDNAAAAARNTIIGPVDNLTTVQAQQAYRDAEQAAEAEFPNMHLQVHHFANRQQQDMHKYSYFPFRWTIKETSNDAYRAKVLGCLHLLLQNCGLVDQMHHSLWMGTVLSYKEGSIVVARP